MNYQAKFAAGLPYEEFLQRHGSPQHRDRWAGIHQQVKLSQPQQALLAGFVREMKVLVLAGAWCGDCANQCPIFAHFAAGTPKIQLRFYDRDEHPDLGEVLTTCGAHRVPAVLFLSEDNHVCGRYGDRTLSKYRAMAAAQFGAACPTGIGGETQSLLEAVVQDWLNEFERIQLMLRLSSRLRSFHGD